MTAVLVENVRACLGSSLLAIPNFQHAESCFCRRVSELHIADFAADRIDVVLTR